MLTQRGFVSAAVLIAIVLGIVVLGGGGYFVMQNKSVKIEVVQDTSAAQSPAAQEPTAETELWVVTTKANTVFIMNAENTPENWDSPHESVREAYESSYAKVVSVYIPMPVGLKIWDSQVSSTDANIFFVTANDQQGLEYAYLLNFQQKTVTKLFSSIEHPDFKLAAMGGVSPDDSAIRFVFASCRDCGGGIVGEAVFNVLKRVYRNLGLTGAFRWKTNGDFEYKSVPQGCESHFGSNLDGVHTTSCDNKLAAASWIQGSW